MLNKVLFLLLFPLLAFCQERKPIQGKVIDIDAKQPVSNVFVINKKTGTEAKTDAAGLFTLLVKEGDAIAVYSTGIESRNFVISAASFKEVPYVVEVSYKADYQLEEVVINDSINSESLGFGSAKPKYTPAERKMHAADGSSMETLFNALSGRGTALKKAVEMEGLISLMGKLEAIYTDKQIAENFKIPVEGVKGFKYYVVEDKGMADALKKGDKAWIEFHMTGLAEKYLQMQTEKNE